MVRSTRGIRRNTHKRRSSDFHPLQRRGIAAVALGAGLLLMPALTGASSMLGVIADSLRIPAWLALGAGAFMLGVYWYFRRQAVPSAGIQARSPTPLNAERRKELRRRIDDAIRAHDSQDENENTLYTSSKRPLAP